MNDLTRLGLKGKVERLMHIDYKSINPTDTSQLKIDHFILAPNNYTIIFNGSGYLEKKIEYEYLWKLDSLKPKGLWIHSYDHLDRINKETYIWNNYSNDTTIWTYKYYGDSITLVTKFYRVIGDHHNKILFRYAQNGSNEILTTSNSDSSYLTRQLFAYDKYNRLIRREEYEDQHTLTFIRSWNYSDSLSREPSVDVGISAKHNYGPIIIINEYDSLGNVISSKGIDPKSTKMIKYTYDEAGNWIERRTKLPNDMIKISRRKIKYYEK